MQSLAQKASPLSREEYIQPSDSLLLLGSTLLMFFGAPTVNLFPESIAATLVTMITVYLIFNRPHVAVALYILIQSGMLGFFESHDLPCITRSFFTVYIADTMLVIWIFSLMTRRAGKLLNTQVRSLSSIVTVFFLIVFAQLLFNMVFGDDQFNIPIRMSRKYHAAILFFIILYDVPVKTLKFIISTIIIMGVLGAALHIYMLITKDNLMYFNTSYHEDKFSELSKVGEFEVARETNRSGKVIPELASVFLLLFLRVYSHRVTQYLIYLLMLLASVALSYTRSLYFQFMALYGYGFGLLFRYISSRQLSNVIVLVLVFASLFVMYEFMMGASDEGAGDANISNAKELLQSFSYRASAGVNDLINLEGTVGLRFQREGGKFTALGVGVPILFGMGFNSLRLKLTSLDSGVIEYILDFGLLGLAILIFMGIFIYRCGFKDLSHFPLNAQLTLKLLGFVSLLMMIVSITQTYIINGLFYGLTLGLLARFREEYHRQYTSDSRSKTNNN